MLALLSAIDFEVTGYKILSIFKILILIRLSAIAETLMVLGAFRILIISVYEHCMNIAGSFFWLF